MKLRPSRDLKPLRGLGEKSNYDDDIRNGQLDQCRIKLMRKDLIAVIPGVELLPGHGTIVATTLQYRSTR